MACALFSFFITFVVIFVFVFTQVVFVFTQVVFVLTEVFVLARLTFDRVLFTHIIHVTNPAVGVAVSALFRTTLKQEIAMVVVEVTATDFFVLLKSDLLAVLELDSVRAGAFL